MKKKFVLIYLMIFEKKKNHQKANQKQNLRIR